MTPGKKKALLIGGFVAVTVLGFAFAASKASAKETKKEEKDEKDDEITVVPPGPSGVPVDHPNSPEIKVLPAPMPDDVITQVNPAPAPVMATNDIPNVITTPGEEIEPPILTSTAPKSEAEKILEVSKETGKSEQEIVKEVVQEMLPPGTKVEPVTTAELSPELDPYGTVKLAHEMLARETWDGWKSDLTDKVEAWQKKVGLKADGQFGVNSAAKMAEEVAILPLVRFWTLGKHWDKKSALADYQPKIRAVIETLKKGLPDSQAHITGLEKSIGREQAQALSSKTAVKQPVLEFASEVVGSVIKDAETQGLKDIA